VVPYRGTAPAMQDLVAGQIDLFFSVPVQLPLLRAGSNRQGSWGLVGVCLGFAWGLLGERDRQSPGDRWRAPPATLSMCHCSSEPL